MPLLPHSVVGHTPCTSAKGLKSTSGGREACQSNYSLPHNTLHHSHQSILHPKLRNKNWAGPGESLAVLIGAAGCGRMATSSRRGGALSVTPAGGLVAVVLLRGSTHYGSSSALLGAKKLGWRERQRGDLLRPQATMPRHLCQASAVARVGAEAAPCRRGTKVGQVLLRTRVGLLRPQARVPRARRTAVWREAWPDRKRRSEEVLGRIPRGAQALGP